MTVYFVIGGLCRSGGVALLALRVAPLPSLPDDGFCLRVNEAISEWLELARAS